MPQSVDLQYAGATGRIGLGYDSDNHLRGDGLWIFREDAASAWLGEFWAASSSAGGVQLSYHWQPGSDRDAAVRKFFVAADQNQWRDRKVTVGGGFENAKWFATGYASAAATGRRLLFSDAVTFQQTVTGVDAGRPYEQDILTTNVTSRYERAYDYGVGLRAGHFYEPALLRLEVGGDYEWGKSSAAQATLSLGVEKYFAGSPWSIAVFGEAYRKRGDFEQTRDDQRITAMLRYEFGGAAWRPAREYRMVPVENPAPATAAAAPAAVAAAPAAPRTEQRIVKTTASMASDAFFDFDKSVLRPDALAALDAAAARLKTAGFEGNLRITGHTCDIGTVAYNLKLSQRRADAVRTYLVAAGIPADRIIAEGLGKADPKYPNDAANRPKNRRVDLEFVTFESRTETVTLPPLPVAAPPSTAAATVPPAPQIEYRREELATEPTWLRRSLHNPAHHKQSVDVYTTQERTTTVVAGEKRFVNRPPAAVPDAYTINANSGATLLNVIANDTDPDGNAIRVTAVTAPAHGTATVSGTQVSYTPAGGYVGTDTFNYTIADTNGLTSSAVVTITIVNTAHPPVAVADAYTVGSDGGPYPLDVLANDSDPDGNPISITAVTAPAHGTASIAGGKVNYTPAPGYAGADGFGYTITDSKGGTATAAVALTVVKGNHPPVAKNDFALAHYNQPVTIDVLANDVDPDGDPLTIVSFSQGFNGAVSRGPGNTLVYLSKLNFLGYDYFTYTISDGKGGTSTATVTVFADP
jgi:outer membrane protein OmpA-like peptidoglycan-associated protein